MKKKPFYVERVGAGAEEDELLPWGVYERVVGSQSKKLTSRWQYREDAREAARSLNEEEPLVEAAS